MPPWPDDASFLALMTNLATATDVPAVARLCGEAVLREVAGVAAIE